MDAKNEGVSDMKQKGNTIVGDPLKIDRYTANWLTVNLHPTTFYRHFDKFQKGFSKVKGLYAEVDHGYTICIRFSEKEDVTEFHRLHHEYI